MKATRRLGALLLVASVLVAGAAAVAGADTGTYELDDGHGLATNESVSEFRSTGYATGEADSLDLTLSVAREKEDVGLLAVFPLDVRNDYLRIQYREDISRTLRIWIPAEYATPYTRETVEAVGSSHTASYQPVRDGEYLQVVIEVDGAVDVVLPIQRDAEATYSVVDRYESRIDELTGADREWEYLDEDRLEEEHIIKINASAEDVVIQYDATPDQPEQTWINTPRGDSGPDGVYWYSPSSEPNTVYLVTNGEDVPAVRVMRNGTRRHELRGDINDATLIDDRIRDILETNPSDWF